MDLLLGFDEQQYLCNQTRTNPSRYAHVKDSCGRS